MPQSGVDRVRQLLAPGETAGAGGSSGVARVRALLPVTSDDPAPPMRRQRDPFGMLGGQPQRTFAPIEPAIGPPREPGRFLRQQPGGGLANDEMGAVMELMGQPRQQALGPAADDPRTIFVQSGDPRALPPVIQAQLAELGQAAGVDLASASPDTRGMLLERIAPQVRPANEIRGPRAFGIEVGRQLAEALPPIGATGQLRQDHRTAPYTGGGWATAGTIGGAALRSAPMLATGPAGWAVAGATYAAPNMMERIDEVAREGGTSNQQVISGLGRGLSDILLEIWGAGKVGKIGAALTRELGYRAARGEWAAIRELMETTTGIAATEGTEELMQYAVPELIDAAGGLQTFEEAAKKIRQNAPQQFVFGAAAGGLLGPPATALGRRARAQLQQQEETFIEDRASQAEALGRLNMGRGRTTAGMEPLSPTRQIEHDDKAVRMAVAQQRQRAEPERPKRENIESKEDPEATAFRWKQRNQHYQEGRDERVQVVGEQDGVRYEWWPKDLTKQNLGIAAGAVSDEDLLGTVYAVRNGEAVGQMLTQRNEGGGLWVSVEVRPDARRQGIASRMADVAEQITGDTLAQQQGTSDQGRAFLDSRLEAVQIGEPEHIDTIGRNEHKMELVARDAQGQPIGVVEFTELDGVAHVDMVTVRPDRQRKGVGTKLLQTLNGLYPEVQYGMAVSQAGEKLAAKVPARQREANELAEPENARAFLENVLDLKGERWAREGKFFTSGSVEELAAKVAEAERASTGRQTTLEGEAGYLPALRAREWRDQEKREELREQIVRELMTLPRAEHEADIRLGNGGGAPRAPIRYEKKAVIVIGPPGAGKSTLAEPIADALGAVMPDADMAKLKLPESDGGRKAALVHLESSQLTWDAVGRLMGQGSNLVVQTLGNNRRKVLDYAERLKESGYEVQLVLNHLDPHEAARRVLTRFDKVNRYLPVGFVINSVGDLPLQVYNELRGQNPEAIDGFAGFINDTPFGQLPRLTDTDGRASAVLQALGIGSDGGAGPAGDADTRGQDGAAQGERPASEDRGDAGAAEDRQGGVAGGEAGGVRPGVTSFERDGRTWTAVSEYGRQVLTEADSGARIVPNEQIKPTPSVYLPKATGGTEEAMNEGKKIPADVLADYPELAGQQQPEAETVTEAALKWKGQVYTGPFHFAAIEAAGIPLESIDEAVADEIAAGEGFITNTGRFVTRQEAAQIMGVQGDFTSEQMGAFGAAVQKRAEGARAAEDLKREELKKVAESIGADASGTKQQLKQRIRGRVSAEQVELATTGEPAKTIPERMTASNGVPTQPAELRDDAGHAEKVAPPEPAAVPPELSFEPVQGREMTLRTAGGRTFSARYVIYDADDLQASHLVREGFALNPWGDANERAYHDPTEGAGPRATVAEIAQNLPDRLDLHLTDTPTPVDGPPIVSRNQHGLPAVLGGNARTMGLQRAYANGTADAYREAVIASLQRFGFSPDAELPANPVLVREIPADQAGQRGQISRLLNESLTTGRTAATDAVSRASRLTESALVRIAEEFEAEGTVRAALSGARGRRIARLFVETGAMTDADVVRLLDEDGIPNGTGRQVIEDAIVAVAVPNVRALASVPGQVRMALTRAAPAIVQLRRHSAEENAADFNIDQALVDSIEAFIAFKRSNYTDFLPWAAGEQLSLLGAEHWRYPEALALAWHYESDKPLKLVDRFRAFARYAEDRARGQSGLFNPGNVALSGTEAFWTVFKNPLGGPALDPPMQQTTLYANPIPQLLGLVFEAGGVAEDAINTGLAKVIDGSISATQAAIGAPAQALTSWLADTPIGKIGGVLAQVARDQTLPLSAFSDEAARLVREQRVQDALARQVAMEYGQLLAGTKRRSKLLGFEVPRELATVENRRQMYEVLVGNAELDTLPAELRPLAQSVGNVIEQLGERAVEVGLLRRETFGRNRRRYLPRFYKPIELERQGLSGITRRLQIIGERFKFRASDSFWIEGPGGSPIRGPNGTPRFDSAEERDAYLDKLVLHQFLEAVNRAQRPAKITIPRVTRTPLDDGEIESRQEAIEQINAELADMDPEDPNRAEALAMRRAIRYELKHGKRRETYDSPGEAEGDVKEAGRPVPATSFFTSQPITEADLFGAGFAALPPATQAALANIEAGIRAEYTTHDPLDIDALRAKGMIEEPGYPVAKAIIQLTHDISVRQLFNKLDQRMEWVQDQDTPGFAQMPTGAKYGPLSGKWVWKPLHREIAELADAPSVALQLYDSAMRLWKTGKTVYNPATHGRNIMGNVMFSEFARCSLLSPLNAHYYADAVKLLTGRLGRQKLMEAKRLGVIGGDIVTQELAGILDSVEVDPEVIGARPLDWIWKFGTLRPIRRGLGTLYRVEDEVFKLASWLKQQDQGMTPREASDYVRTWFPFYDQIPNTWLVRNVGRRGAMPFVSFYYEALRIGAHSLRQRPGTLLKWLAVPQLITALSAYTMGLDDDDLEAVRRSSRGTMWGWPVFSALLPWRDAQGRLQQWDLTNVVPYADLLGKRIDRGDREPDWWSRAAQKVMLGNPLTNIGVGLATQQDPYFGRRFVHTGMGPWERMANAGEFVGKTLLPPLTPIVGTGWRVFDTSEIPRGTLQKRDVTQARLRSLVGVDIRFAGPDLYRSIDKFLEDNEVPEEPTVGDTTPRSRARTRLYQAILNEDVDGMAAAMMDLEDLGLPSRSVPKVLKVIDTRHPLRRIPTDLRPRFRGSLSTEEEKVLDATLAEYANIRRRAPIMFSEAIKLVRERAPRAPETP